VEEARVLRITKQADYGILLMACFVSSSDTESRSARDLARAAQLPQPMVGKILKTLVQRGLLRSSRGSQGGYRLARPASEITVADIIAALEGPIAVTTCNIHGGDCNIENVCLARGNWRRINAAVRDALHGISLEEMAHPLGGRGGAGVRQAAVKERA
jgi:FeS assembly SUF system regulator